MINTNKISLNELPKKDNQTIVNLGSINNKLNPPLKIIPHWILKIGKQQVLA